jgi:hypothetical protein
MIFDGEHDQVITAFWSALGAIEPVARTMTADTGKFSYRYVDLGAVLEEVKRACQLFKLAVSQNTWVQDGMVATSTYIIHESGQYLTFEPLRMRLGNDPQAVGSAMTYSRRYALVTIFGIATEDDDAQAAKKEMVAATATYRSAAEERIHNEMAALAPEQGRALREAFREHFGRGLSDLPVNRHGEALTFVLEEIEDLKFSAQLEAEKAIETPAEAVVEE